MATKRKYELTEEHRAQLAPWRDRWIANGLNITPMDDGDRDAMRVAINGLYDAAKLARPERIVFCASPISGAIAASVASGVWWLRENPKQHQPLFGRQLTEADLAHALVRAVAFACARGVHMTRTLKSLPAVPVAGSAATEAATGAATGDATWAATGAATGDATRAATRDPVAMFLVRCSEWWSRFYSGGNFWSGYTSYLAFFRHIAKLELPEYERFQHYEAAAIHGGPRFMHAKFCIVSDRPMVIAKDDWNRPHRDDGPFIAWHDGWSLYASHGVRVPAHVIEAPASITVAEIEAETNAEVRRVMIERYGAARYLLDSGAKAINRTKYGVLYRKEVAGDEPIVMVRLLNSTPEPDGSMTSDEARREFGARIFDRTAARAGSTADARWKAYMLRVPPTVADATEAVAWLSGKTAATYQPLVET